jgi:flagellar biosynthesis/type III secretory pathway protein FliH
LKQALLGCISKRAAETVNEEISFLGSVKKKDIEAAQLRIVDSVRQLESEGEIEIHSAPGATRDEPWSETLTLPKPLRDAASAGEPARDARAESAEEVRASYERRARRRKAMSEQLLPAARGDARIVRGVLESLRQAVPQIVRDTENTMIALALSVAQKLVADMPISVAMVEAAVRDALAQVEGTAQFTVRLHPADLELLQKPIRRCWPAATAQEFRFLGPRRKSPAAAAWCKPALARSMPAAKPNSTFCKGPLTA